MEDKIVILGVANGGKTSLLRTLKREFKSLEDLKPTKGIERTAANVAKLGHDGRGLPTLKKHVNAGGRSTTRNAIRVCVAWPRISTIPSVKRLPEFQYRGRRFDFPIRLSQNSGRW